MKPVVIALVLEQHKAKRDVDGNLPVSVRLYDPNTQKAKKYRTGVFTTVAKFDKVAAGPTDLFSLGLIEQATSPSFPAYGSIRRSS